MPIPAYFPCTSGICARNLKRNCVVLPRSTAGSMTSPRSAPTTAPVRNEPSSKTLTRSANRVARRHRLRAGDQRRQQDPLSKCAFRALYMAAFAAARRSRLPVPLRLLALVPGRRVRLTSHDLSACSLLFAARRLRFLFGRSLRHDVLPSRRGPRRPCNGKAHR